MSEVSSESAPIAYITPVTISKNNETHTDSQSVQITNIRLNGDNFLRWSQSVQMYIRDRGKIEYLTGEKKASTKEDPSYAT